MTLKFADQGWLVYAKCVDILTYIDNELYQKSCVAAVCNFNISVYPLNLRIAVGIVRCLMAVKDRC